VRASTRSAAGVGRLAALRDAARRIDAAAVWSRGIDVGLIACLVLTPLALGGRHDLGRLVYAGCVGFAAVATAGLALERRSGWRAPIGPTVLWGLAVVSVALQLVPLPDAWLSAVCPGHAPLLPAWTDGAPLGTWRTVSLAPAETLEGLALLVSHGLLFLVVYRRIDSVSDVRTVMLALGTAAAALAVLALAAWGFPSRRLLWFYDVPQWSFEMGPQGSFANRNHFAHSALLGAAAWSPWLLLGAGEAKGPGRPHGVLTARGVVAAVLVVGLVALALATRSRGALLALVTGLAAGAAIRVAGVGWRLREVVGVAALAAAAIGAVSLAGYERVTSRLGDLVSADLSRLDPEQGRQMIWSANLRGLAANPWLGHGAGSHALANQAYLDAPCPKEFTHAESGYLQIGFENGSVGLALLAAMLLLIAWRIATARSADRERNAILVGLTAALAVSVAHSVVDFVWYLPALAGAACAIAACLWRLPQVGAQHAPSEPSRRRGQLAIPPVAVAAAAVVSVASLWAPASGSVDADHYARAAKTIATLQAELVNAEPDARPQLAASIAAVSERAAEDLQRVVAADPTNAEAHARLASRYLERFEAAGRESGNAMPVATIADTAASGGFGSAAEVNAWLDRAFGDSADLLRRARLHAEAAVRYGPTQGAPYLRLASLAFLENPNPATDKLVEQAVRVAPHDGGVRYEAGRQSHARGDLPVAIEHYRLSLRDEGAHRGPLVDGLARFLPAATLIEYLEPGADVSDLLLAAYQRHGGDADLHAIAEHAEGLLDRIDPSQEPIEAARRWRHVSQINKALGDHGAAARCALRAHELAPYDFWVRLQLATALYDAERFEEADPHIRYCLARRPDLRELHYWLKRTTAMRAVAARTPRVAATPGGSAGSSPPATPADAHTGGANRARR